MRIVIDPHCRRRMRERGITPEEMAWAWMEFVKERKSQDHPEAKVRTGTRPDGTAITVVAAEDDEVLYFWTVW